MWYDLHSVSSINQSIDGSINQLIIERKCDTKLYFCGYFGPGCSSFYSFK